MSSSNGFGSNPSIDHLRDLEDCRTLFVTQAADRSGAPLLLLWFLRWVRDHTPLRFEVLTLRDGPMVDAFRELCPVHVIDRLGPIEETPRTEITRALGREHLLRQEKDRLVHEQAEQLRGYDLLVLNSAMSGAAVELLPELPPVVITWLHDMGTSFGTFVVEQQRNAVLDLSDWFITCADVVTATIVGGFGVPRQRIARHHGFIDPPVPDPEGSRRIREQLGVGPDAVLVGGAGVSQWRKGPDLFVQVAFEVLRRRPDLDVHFVWAGGADPHGDQPPLADDIERTGMGERVHLVGEYTSAEAMIGAFDIYCLTSREDPFPLVMLEAAGLGVPIVSFDNGGVVELAAASGDPERPLALVVDYLGVREMAEAVIGLVEDEEARQQLSDRARKHVLSELVTDHAAPRIYEELGHMVAASASPRLRREGWGRGR